jgi:methylase of polypeptide subunit release factors
VERRLEVRQEDLSETRSTQAGGSSAVDAPPPPVAQVPEPDADDRFVAMDPARVLADAEGCEALSSLVRRLRSIGYDGSPGSATASPEARAEAHAVTLVALARGSGAKRDAVDAALGADAVAALHRCGAMLLIDDEAGLSAKIFPMRSVYTLLPHHQEGQDFVYLGRDSVCLLEVTWAARGHGDRAVDLGTGNGFIAAALATRYDHVIAADLSHRCVATAALVPVLNPHLRGRFDAVQMDVTNGLRRESFDLVTANAPWVPETRAPDGSAPRRFAAGGPTGFELPRRFIDEAADLLAPGGRAVIACSDLEFTDGRRPLLDHLPSLEARGVGVGVVPTRINELNDFDEWAQRKAPGATSARHVVVGLRRAA